MKRVSYFLTLLFVVGVLCTSCREKSTGEKVGDAVEDVVDDVEDAVD